MKLTVNVTWPNPAGTIRDLVTTFKLYNIPYTSVYSITKAVYTISDADWERIRYGTEVGDDE